MGSSDSTPEGTQEGVRSLFTRLEQPSMPLTTTEVAETLECSRKTAEDRLNKLTEHDSLQTRRIDDATRVWWQPEKSTSAGQHADREEFAAFVSAVQDYAIFMLDPDGVVASWNEGAERIKGYEEDEIVGEHFSTFYTAAAINDGDPERNLETAAEEGRVEDEGWRVRADGSRFWANATITAIRDDDGMLQGFTKVTQDMSERRTYEQELRRERDLTQQILETVPVSICMITATGEIVRANQRMLDRVGIEESELGEYSIDSWEIYDTEGEPIPVEEWPWTRVLETGESVYNFQCQTGVPALGRRWLSLNAAPIEDEQYEDELVVVSADDITEQKERERQLLREYNQTEKLLRTAPIAIAVQDADGETVMANQRAQDALGLSEQEFIEEPEDADEWQIYDANANPISPKETPSARVLETGEPVFDEELAIEPPGSERMQFRLNATPIHNADGEIERVITAGKDITELKKHERQLEQRKTELEIELSEIFERISDAFYALDADWRFTHVNEHAAELMQRSRDDLLGREIWEIVPDATESIYWEKLRAAMDTQESVSFEVYEEMLGAWLEFNVYPSETGLSIYFRDITERKERERKLEESEQRYRTLVGNFPNGAVALVDKEVTYQTVGGTPLNVVNATPEEIEGRPVAEAVPAKLADELVPCYRAALDGESNAFEIELKDRVYRFQVVPVRDDDGDVFAALGMSQDITERREYERKLEESNERLEQFAYAASHDLQEPLRMVSSYLQLIDRRYGDDLDEDGEQFLEFAVDGADRMREMIEGLLEYSRVETRGDPLEPIALDSVLENVVTDLHFQIEESNADLTVESLPRVEGDASQLRQVFQNLLENAIKYSGDEPPQVHVGAEQDGNQWVISVSDQGVGIDPADTVRVFEVFQRLHTREESSGTGIGLALCERIVERHGGDIWVDSEPGDGATFSFTLPAVTEPGM